MMRVRQSTHGHLRLPALLVVVLGICVPWGAAVAQQFRVRQEENFRRDSTTTSTILGSVRPGTVLEGGPGGRWIPVTLEGWIWSRSVGASPGPGFDLSVTLATGENLRDEPNGQILARLELGCLLEEVERRGNWVHVRRSGWMWAQSLEARGPATVPVVAPPGRVSAVEETGPSLDRALLATETEIVSVPEGDVRGTLQPDTPTKILARSGDWVRVQVEGWVREDALRPGSPGVLVGVSGAEVRSRPEEFVGKVLQWTLQYVALQVADEVRMDIPNGARYMLARGPRPETGFVYVVLNDDQAAAIERLQPLTDLVVVGRVRAGRSRYLGNPVLQLIAMDVREP